MSEWPLIVHGDIEAACIDILKSATEVQAFTPKVHVSSNMFAVKEGADIIRFDRKMRWIEVIREGGAAPWPFKADKPRVDFFCYAESRTAANDIAQVAQGVLLRSLGDYVGNGVRITNVKVETGIFRVPDKDTDTPRYSFSLRFTCTPE